MQARILFLLVFLPPVLLSSLAWQAWKFQIYAQDKDLTELLNYTFWPSLECASDILLTYF